MLYYYMYKILAYLIFISYANTENQSFAQDIIQKIQHIKSINEIRLDIDNMDVECSDEYNRENNDDNEIAILNHTDLEISIPKKYLTKEYISKCEYNNGRLIIEIKKADGKLLLKMKKSVKIYMNLGSGKFTYNSKYATDVTINAGYMDLDIISSLSSLEISAGTLNGLIKNYNYPCAITAGRCVLDVYDNQENRLTQDVKFKITAPAGRLKIFSKRAIFDNKRMTAMHCRDKDIYRIYVKSNCMMSVGIINE